MGEAACVGTIVCMDKILKELRVWDRYAQEATACVGRGSNAYIAGTSRLTAADCALFPVLAWLVRHGCPMEFALPHLWKYFFSMTHLQCVRKSTPTGWDTWSNAEKAGMDLWRKGVNVTRAVQNVLPSSAGANPCGASVPASVEADMDAGAGAGTGTGTGAGTGAGAGAGAGTEAAVGCGSEDASAEAPETPAVLCTTTVERVLQRTDLEDVARAAGDVMVVSTAEYAAIKAAGGVGALGRNPRRRPFVPKPKANDSVEYTSETYNRDGYGKDKCVLVCGLLCVCLCACGRVGVSFLHSVFVYFLVCACAYVCVCVASHPACSLCVRHSPGFAISFLVAGL